MRFYYYYLYYYFIIHHSSSSHNYLNYLQYCSVVCIFIMLLHVLLHTFYLVVPCSFHNVLFCTTNKIYYHRGLSNGITMVYI